MFIHENVSKKFKRLISEKQQVNLGDSIYLRDLVFKSLEGFKRLINDFPQNIVFHF